MTIQELWNLIMFLNFKTSLVIAPHPPPPTPSVIMTLCVRKSICDSPLSPLKKIKDCIPSHLFLVKQLEKLSSCYVSLSDLLTTIFVNPWKNQKYLSIINLFTSLLQMKLFLLFLNNIAFTKKCAVEESISFTIFFLQMSCDQKHPFRGSPESTCYYKFQQRSSFFS